MGPFLDDSVVFAATLFLTAVGLFIVSTWMLAAARSNTLRKTILIKRETRQLEGECAALDEQLIDLRARYRMVEAEERAIATEVAQLRRSCAAAAQDTFEIVHEVGTPAEGVGSFVVEVLLNDMALTEGPAASQLEPRVWAVRNIVQIWAPGQDEALQMAGRAFPSRFGYVITRFVDASSSGGQP
jgi:hypothetical protein